MTLALYFGTGLIALIISLIIKHVLFLRKLPPGPWGYPFLGSFVQLYYRSNMLEEFEKYKEQYGPIFSVGVGSYNVIVINGYKRIQEALKLDVFSGRPGFQIWMDSNDGVPNRGILTCDANTTWYEQRRFALRNLRDFGFGKESMEGLLLHEVDQLLQHMRKDVGKPICPRMLFNASVLNSLWYITTGHRFELQDPEFQQLISAFTTHMRRSYLVGPALFLEKPFKLLNGKVWSETIKMRQDIWGMMKSLVTEHQATYEDELCRDFIDAYLKQRKADSNSSFTSAEGVNNLLAVLKDLFQAGVETTSTTLFWTLLYLTRDPKIQQRVHKEIDSVIGRNRLPSRDDKTKLLYVEAVLSEVARSASLLPVSLYHTVQQDTEFQGQFFPKGAIIMPNLYEAHHNREYWKDPENFRPERFLNETETALVKHEAFMPFSTGKRVCLGETLARDTLFLFMVSLFQNFSFTLAPAYQNRDLTGTTPTLVVSPEDFDVIVIERD